MSESKFVAFPKEIVVVMQAGCSPGHPLTPTYCLDIIARSEPVTTETVRSARYRLLDPIETSADVPRCAACGLPFRADELRALQPDGSSMHDETQPDSMRRCREALLAQRCPRQVSP